ncbi:hypothetical protein E1293_08560 [Actinomadura darangshiensis]|uniref:Uncharacterized protein n=1 Tax=Actinomadura darangshiensis TaxID=705336 RepID=A0A4R5BS81_9ACTN|nr:hypothetical protein [Actinomadura darangshiensis]TDD86992.1 hypothetical protein E1293_08560 [Actinomadura darangshiensis]
MSETDDLEQPPPDDVGGGGAATEANEADAAEQRAGLDEADDRVDRAPMPDDANEADAAEQRREVRLDEDDYR